MNGHDLATALEDVDGVELEDFTRDGYKSMWVLAHSSRAKDRVIALAEEADYVATVGGALDEETAAYRLTVQVSERVRKGGNRL